MNALAAPSGTTKLGLRPGSTRSGTTRGPKRTTAPFGSELVTVTRVPVIPTKGSNSSRSSCAAAENASANARSGTRAFMRSH